MQDLGSKTEAALLDTLDRPPSHSELVYERLKRLLLGGRVTGGTLLSESELARQLGVSTTPVHEAVVRLQSEGFVMGLPRRGIRVVHLTPRDISEIFELREALESEVIRLTLTRAPQGDLDELRRFVAAGDAALATGEYSPFNAADIALHEALATAAGNRRLQQTLNDLRVWVQRIRVATVENNIRLPGRPQKAQDEHRLLVEALIRRDSAAEGIVRQHISSLKDEILAYMHAHGIGHI
jgi:DNA-binding GntR family transcriptional regulator